MEAHHTGIQWTYLEVKRSKVKVTRPINANTVNVQYLPNGKAYELQTSYTEEHKDLHQRQAPWPSRSKVKCTVTCECLYYFRVRPLITATASNTLMADGGASKVCLCHLTYVTYILKSSLRFHSYVPQSSVLDPLLFIMYRVHYPSVPSSCSVTKPSPLCKWQTTFVLFIHPIFILATFTYRML